VKKIFSLVLVVFIASFILPQNSGNLSGVVTDAITGDALPGVNVIIKGTYFGTATDLNGKFKLNNISAGTYNVDIS
jgi:hypothetical protein